MKKISDIKQYDDCMKLLSACFVRSKELEYHTGINQGSVLWLLRTLNKKNMVNRIQTKNTSYWKLVPEYRVPVEDMNMGDYDLALLTNREKELLNRGD